MIKKSMISIFIMVLFLLGGVSCATAAHHKHVKPKFSMYTLGEEFNITLKSNPTTGHEWIETYNPKYLKLINKTYIPDPNPQNLCGNGGHTVFTFKTLKTGTTRINFNYQHVGNSKTISKAEYKIKIK